MSERTFEFVPTATGLSEALNHLGYEFRRNKTLERGTRKRGYEWRKAGDGEWSGISEEWTEGVVKALNARCFVLRPDTAAASRRLRSASNRRDNALRDRAEVDAELEVLDEQVQYLEDKYGSADLLTSLARQQMVSKQVKSAKLDRVLRRCQADITEATTAEETPVPMSPKISHRSSEWSDWLAELAEARRTVDAPPAPWFTR